MKIQVTRSRVFKILLGFVLAGFILFLFLGDHPSLNVEALLEKGRSIPAPAFIAAMFVLPLCGCPINLFLIVAGTRFGFGNGFLLTACAMVFHHLLAYRIAHARPRSWLLQRLERWGYKVPVLSRGHQVRWTALFAAIYGPPYAAKLYLLALTDIPPRVYLWVGMPVYLLFAIPSLAFGHALGTESILWIMGVLIAVLVILPWIRRRFGRRESEGKGGVA